MFAITVVVCDLFCLYYVYLQYICICIKFIIQCTFRSMGKDTLYIYILRIRTLVSLLQLLFAMSQLGLYVVHVCLTGVGFIGQGSTCTLMWAVHECPYLDVVIQYYSVSSCYVVV